MVPPEVMVSVRLKVPVVVIEIKPVVAVMTPSLPMTLLVPARLMVVPDRASELPLARSILLAASCVMALVEFRLRLPVKKLSPVKLIAPALIRCCLRCWRRLSARAPEVPTPLKDIS